jgi:Protein of unknown function (DUF3828)
MKKLLLFICLLSASCSIPQIEDAKCTESRETVRSFYAQHLSESQIETLNTEEVGKKEKWLTPELYQLLQKAAAMDPAKAIKGDPFTFSTEFPTGFKVGECQVSGEQAASHTVRLFWKVGSERGEHLMKVETEKRGDRWLIKNFIDPQRGTLVELLSK